MESLHWLWSSLAENKESIGALSSILFGFASIACTWAALQLNKLNVEGRRPLLQLMATTADYGIDEETVKFMYEFQLWNRLKVGILPYSFEFCAYTTAGNLIGYKRAQDSEWLERPYEVIGYSLPNEVLKSGDMLTIKMDVKMKRRRTEEVMRINNNFGANYLAVNYLNPAKGRHESIKFVNLGWGRRFYAKLMWNHKMKRILHRYRKWRLGLR